MKDIHCFVLWGFVELILQGKEYEETSGVWGVLTKSMKTQRELTFHTEGKKTSSYALASQAKWLKTCKAFLSVPSPKVGPENLVKPWPKSTPSKVTFHLGPPGTPSCFDTHSLLRCFLEAPAPPCLSIWSNYWQPSQRGRDGFQAGRPLGASSAHSKVHAAAAYWGLLASSFIFYQ